MAGSKTDDRAYKNLIRLFGIYKKESEKGKLYLFQEKDICTETVSLEGREEARSLEEGLYYLGNIIYLVLTGKDGNVDRSIKIDGYPKLDIFFWPVLEVLLASDNPTIETVEERIKELEEGLEKVEELAEVGGEEFVYPEVDEKKVIDDISRLLAGTDKKTFERIMEEIRKRLHPEPEKKIISFRHRNGNTYEIDTSREACKKFGYFAGERVRTPEGPATVLGVHEDNLWFQFDDSIMYAGYFGSNRVKDDFDKEGFGIIDKPSERKVSCVAFSGITIELDVSREACEPFGFYAGERIRTPLNYLATVMGVFDGYLWYKRDNEPFVVHWGNKISEEGLIKEGFVRI